VTKTRKQKVEISEEGTWAEKQKKKKTEMKGYEDDDEDEDKDRVVLTIVHITCFSFFFIRDFYVYIF
jgi:hypothetical protein